MVDGVASWADRDGCERTALVKGSKIQTAIATWTDSKGTKSAPLDHSESVILVAAINYTADFTVGTRRVRKSTRVSDKAVAQRIANKWEEDERLALEGVRDDADENFALYRRMPLKDHIDAFIDFRSTGGGDPDHRERTRKHIEEFAKAGNWATVRDIHVDHVTRHAQSLKKSGSASRTIQARLQSIKSFTKWLYEHDRIKRNPLSSVKKPNPEQDRKHERRMMLPDEWRWVESTILQGRIERNSMTAEERLLLYRTAIQTGLRATELAELTRGNLKLDVLAPYITCKAAGTKNKKAAQQFLDTELARDLEEHTARKHPSAPVFGIGSKRELSRTLQADLVDARLAWVQSLSNEEKLAAQESDFLIKTNHRGEHLVFHSLRHSCGAWLAMSGESIKVVQTVMRHSTPVLTLNTYGHLFPGQCESAPRSLAAMMRGDKTPAELSRTSHVSATEPRRSFESP
ncbi:tyrosine recombinase XerD [Rhodopirellula sp. SWK7]|nr:tyrosine recombinase XerD [Rhodopirellula sp. SWK7]